MATLVFLIAVALLGWQEWKGRRAQREHLSADHGVGRLPEQDAGR